MWAVIFAIQCVSSQTCDVARGRFMLLSERSGQDQCAQENYGKAPDERCHDEGAIDTSDDGNWSSSRRRHRSM